MNEQLVADATAELDAAQAKIDELLRIKQLLKTELPAARSVLQAAEKRLHRLTKPTRAAIREHEIETLKRRLNEAKENA